MDKKRPFSVSPLSARFLPGIHHTLTSFIFQCLDARFQIRNRTLKLSDFRLQTLDVGRPHFAIRMTFHPFAGALADLRAGALRR